MKDSWEKNVDKNVLTLMHGVKISLHVNFFLDHHSDKQAGAGLLAAGRVPGAGHNGKLLH